MYDSLFRKYIPIKKTLNPRLIHYFPTQFFSAEKIRQSELKKIKILLVDDHRMMRQGLRKIIDNHDDIVIVGEAADGREAVKLASEKHPDIIIMDVNMPVMDGIEATRKVTDDLSQICVIGLSMNDEKAIMEDMKSAGASAYLQKTEVFESLIKTIRTEVSSL